MDKHTNMDNKVDGEPTNNNTEFGDAEYRAGDVHTNPPSPFRYSPCGDVDYRPSPRYNPCGNVDYPPSPRYSPCGDVDYRPSPRYSPCGDVDYRPSPRYSPRGRQDQKKPKPIPMMNFCTKLVAQLLLDGVEKGENKNMVTSPLSYNAAMNMIAAGSSGETLNQILGFLQCKNMEEVNLEFSKFADIMATPTSTYDYNRNAPVLSFLNGVWVNKKYSLKDSFQDLVGNFYKAKARNIDCEKPEKVVQEINEWAAASTKGCIKEVVGPNDINQDTTLIIGNALYFKGLWNREFDITRELSFYLVNGHKVKAPFMSHCNSYAHKSFQDFQVARIPYRTGGDSKREFSMYIILPNERDGLESLLKSAKSNSQFFTQYCDVPYGERVDIFWIPKFKFDYSTEECVDIMRGMGLTLPFDKEKSNLSEMMISTASDDKLLYVSKIVQKTYITVDEGGTEAASTTFKMCTPTYSPPVRPPTKFVADHPFLFIIREENSGLFIFAGILLNPLQS